MIDLRQPPVADRAGPRWARTVARWPRRPASTTELTAAVTAHTMGSGADVVLVPGLAVSKYLRPVQERLAEIARVHRLDLPGVGTGANVRPLPTLREDAAAVTGWLRAHLHAPAMLVGHSYGTQVAVRAAAADSSLVRGLVLASPTVDPSIRSAHELLWHWRKDLATQPDGLAEVNEPQQRRAGLGRILAMAVSMLADDPAHWLVQVDAPVTVLVGTRDALGTASWGRSLADRAGGTFVSVPGGTHTFPFDHPDALVTAVRTPAGEDELQ